MIGLSFSNNPHSGFSLAQIWPMDTTLLGGMGATLRFSQINPLSSEEARIEGPDSRAKHCQGGAESGQRDAIAYFASSGRDAPEFDNYDQRSGHGCP